MHWSGLDWSDVHVDWLSDVVIGWLDWLSCSWLDVLGLWRSSVSTPFWLSWTLDGRKGRGVELFSTFSAVWLVSWSDCWSSSGRRNDFWRWTGTTSHHRLFDRKHSDFILAENCCPSEFLVFFWGLCVWLFPLNTVSVEIWLMEWLSMTMMSLREDCSFSLAWGVSEQADSVPLLWILRLSQL